MLRGVLRRAHIERYAHTHHRPPWIERVLPRCGLADRPEAWRRRPSLELHWAWSIQPLIDVGNGVLNDVGAKLVRMRSLLIRGGAESTSRSSRPMVNSVSLR